MNHPHQAWLYDIGEKYLLFQLPMYSHVVEDILRHALNFIKNLTLDVEEDIHLYMENQKIPYKGLEHACILVYCPEFPVGVIIFNAKLSKADRIGPYSTKEKKLYSNWHPITPEA